ncbi:hypothetical protein [Mycobacterium sp.]|uniref:hypothetical protein n=1 Tax=Mycobacterium sp. TaxID=1785 RepID=UPI003A8805B1
MKIRRRLAAGAAVVSAVTLGLALDSERPAYAVGPPTDGAYALSLAGTSDVTWHLTALCVQPSGTRNMNDYSDPIVFAMNCVLNVVSTTPANNTHAEHLQNYSSRAQMSSMLWTFHVTKVQGVSCPNGGYAPTDETYAFSDETLTGTHTTLHDAVCGLQPEMSKEPFSLTMVGPTERPVERYPLDCNGIAMCS